MKAPQEEQEKESLYSQLLAGYDPEMCDYNSYKRWCREESGRRMKELKKARWYLDKLIGTYEKV